MPTGTPKRLVVVQFAKSSGMRFSLAVATGSVTQLPTLAYLRDRLAEQSSAADPDATFEIEQFPGRHSNLTCLTFVTCRVIRMTSAFVISTAWSVNWWVKHWSWLNARGFEPPVLGPQACRLQTSRRRVAFFALSARCSRDACAPTKILKRYFSKGDGSALA